jgi:aryl-alcohol dehydrogenase-like predicted oxidoreductase
MADVFYRTLGRSGIQVSAMGLGCWAIGGEGWVGVDDDESIRGIHRGLELGVNLLDTSDVYGPERSEYVIARALQGRRQDVVIATKFGNVYDRERWPNEAGTSPEYIRWACEQSLKRLNTDYIDLYQFHINEYDPTQADEIIETLEALVKEGKIRTYGWSTDFPESVKVFSQGENCAAIQVEENVIDDNAAVLALCEQYNLAALNRGPLAMGILTGKYKVDSKLHEDDVRGPNAPDWMKYFKEGKPNPEWLSKMEAVREILTSGGRTLAQGALAWLWARSEKTLPIPGFRLVSQVEENVGAMHFGPLQPEQMQEIEAILGRQPHSETVA